MPKLSYIVLGLIVAVLVLFPGLSGLYVDYLWFSELGYQGVFLTILKSELAIFVAGLIFFYGFISLNARIAFREAATEVSSSIRKLAQVAVFVFSFILSYGITGGWRQVQLFLNSTPFEVSEPVFSRDLAFYFFKLPFYQYLWSIVFTGVILALIASGIVYFLYSKPVVKREPSQEPEFRDLTEIDLQLPQLSERAMTHLSALGGLVFILLAVNFFLDRFSVLFSESGAVYGGSYADLKVRLPLLSALAVLALLTGILFAVAAQIGDFKLPVAGVALLVVVGVVGNLAVGGVQQYVVEPNEFEVEKPYIERNIEFTRKAYGLEEIKEIDYPARYNLTLTDIQNNQETIKNIRLWDWRPLLRTYRQIQSIRTYYDFNDVDVDRYTVNGEYRQVMVGPREFDITQLKSRSRTWVNRHLFYTHGYGLVMSPVRDVSEEGLPVMYIKDIPPKSEKFNVTQPAIYYGEKTGDYAVVDTNTKEFDYPSGEENVYTTYAGKGGIKLNSIIARAATAFNFGSIKLFISQALTEESKILIHRNVGDRASTLAPFLRYDKDPYTVLSDGKIKWIHDAYTVSDSYPYSEPTQSINYIRNSVKVVTDAYDGSTNFYVINRDPVIETYMKVFPSLFKPFEEMPGDLKEHIRYPVDFFNIQAQKYATYHMQDPRVFYNKEDVWELPNEVYKGKTISMDPYYLITRLPGKEEEEFILLLPFTPRGKENMIAWMAARNDMPMYGEKMIFNFPKEKLIYGPTQIEARIDQNDEISQLFTLWSQSGSNVIRGNLLTIPVKDSLLYVEPVYLRAESKEAIPELKRVIVVFGDQVAMKKTLRESLAAIFGEGEPVGEVRPPEGEEEGVEKGTRELIDEALEHYTKAQEHLREGNWTGYGEEQEKLKAVLEQLASRG